jgi:hypothetical protein
MFNSCSPGDIPKPGLSETRLPGVVATDITRELLLLETRDIDASYFLTRFEQMHLREVVSVVRNLVNHDTARSYEALIHYLLSGSREEREESQYYIFEQTHFERDQVELSSIEMPKSKSEKAPFSERELNNAEESNLIINALSEALVALCGNKINEISSLIAVLLPEQDKSAPTNRSEWSDLLVTRFIGALLDSVSDSTDSNLRYQIARATVPYLIELKNLEAGLAQYEAEHLLNDIRGQFADVFTASTILKSLTMSDVGSGYDLEIQSENPPAYCRLLEVFTADRASGYRLTRAAFRCGVGEYNPAIALTALHFLRDDAQGIKACEREICAILKLGKSNAYLVNHIIDRLEQSPISDNIRQGIQMHRDAFPS